MPNITVLRVSRTCGLSLNFYVEMQRRRPPEVQTADSGTRAEIETASAVYSLARKFSSLQSNFDQLDQYRNSVSIFFNFIISVIFLSDTLRTFSKSKV